MYNTKLHEEKMRAILQAIFTDEIGQFLAFKGGTLTYFIYKLDRFSTDIDLDILDNTQEQLIIERMKGILLKIGDIKNETLGKTLHRWMFRYDERSINIKIELNKRIWTNNTYEYQTIDGNSILCMTPDCIFANKLVALSERFYNRDLYDVHFFFKNNFPLEEDILLERTQLQTKAFLENLIEELPKHFSENSILSGLGEVLDEKQKFLVKTYLLEETITEIYKFLSTHTD